MQLIISCASLHYRPDLKMFSRWRLTQAQQRQLILFTVTSSLYICIFHSLRHNSPPKPHLSLDPAFNQPINPTKTLVILLAAFRSGSTFLGQIFDLNARVQYLFEPFHDTVISELYSNGGIVGARSDHSISDLHVLYIQQMLANCSVFRTNVVGERFEFCGTDEENLFRFNTTKCPLRVKGALQIMPHQEICRYRNVTAIKLIRFTDLRHLLKLQNLSQSRVKIIHLTRHPFAMMTSRRSGLDYFMWNRRTRVEFSRNNISVQRVKTAWEAFNFCFKTLRNMDFVRKNAWLRNRYLRVTHVEMSEAPLATANLVYNFIGEPLPLDVAAEFSKISSGDGFQEPDSPLNVNKLSLYVANKWKDLTSDLVTIWDLPVIEFQCRRLLRRTDEEFQLDGASRCKLLKVYGDLSSEAY